MKICLQNKTPVLTKEINPSWNCSNTCCFYKLYIEHSVSICHQIQKSCTKEYSYTLQDNISDIFTL